MTSQTLALTATVCLYSTLCAQELPDPDPAFLLVSADAAKKQEQEKQDPSEHYQPQADPKAKVVPHDPSVFGPDPAYGDKPYDHQAQLDIYGAKYMNPTQRPLLELGRELYQYGPFRPAPGWLGDKNLAFPQVLAYGDYRTAVAYNDNGKAEQATWAHRLNLELDARLTATERIHAFFRPLDKNGQFTRLDFGGENHEFEERFDGNVDALFFEGDLGSIYGGFTGQDAPFDLPFAAGLMPLLFHNGIWIQDAFTGFAFTIPARNNPDLDWSNFDITFFAGFDKVTNNAVFRDDDDAGIFGVNLFLEANQGYWEVGYAFVDDDDNAGREFHSYALSFTRRYWNRLSNSLRLIGASGQDPQVGQDTADGYVFLIENSLITPRPSTFVPYANFFVGFDHPVSAVRDAGAGGILLNTGINFETDGLTGFPKLDDTANNTWGGAIGVNLLGANLNNQLVLEFAFVEAYGDADERKAPGDQYAVGLRYQHPITHAIILRFDTMYGWLEDAQDIAGIRFEIRYKF